MTAPRKMANAIIPAIVPIKGLLSRSSNTGLGGGAGLGGTVSVVNGTGAFVVPASHTMQSGVAAHSAASVMVEHAGCTIPIDVHVCPVVQ